MIDSKILFSITVSVLLVALIDILYRYYKGQRELVVRYAILVVASYLLGLSLILLRNMIPDFFSIVVANTFFIIGAICVYITSRAVLGLESKWHMRYWIPVAIIFIGFSIYTYLDFNMNARLILHFSFCVLYYALASWLFWIYARSESHRFDRLSAVMFFIFFLFSLFIVFKGTTSKLELNLLSNNDGLLLLPSIDISMLGIWSMLLVRYRPQKT